MKCAAPYTLFAWHITGREHVTGALRARLPLGRLMDERVHLQIERTSLV